MAIDIARSGSARYRVILTPPHGRWASDRELTSTEVLERLSELGCHSTDITDALDSTSDDWRIAHDEEVRQLRDSLQHFTSTLTAMSLSQINRGGDSKTWNALVQRLQRLHLALRESSSGRRGISDLMQDQDEVKRIWSATLALSWDEAVARSVLEAEVARGGPTGFEAEVTLREFDAGRLNTTWIPTGTP